MKDPIERADALAAIALGDTVNQLHAKIRAIPRILPAAPAETEAATLRERVAELTRLTNSQEEIIERQGNTIIRINSRNEDLTARLARMEGAVDPEDAFNKADWFWRTMDPDDCGDSPEEAINRAMVGRFCVCEIASSYAGPTRYGFIAPVLDRESDDEEFVHFATQQEAIDAAKARAALTDGGSNG